MNPPRPGPFTWLNGECCFCDEGSLRLIFLRGVPLYRYDRNDHQLERIVLSMLLRDGVLTLEAAMRGFGYGMSTLLRWKQRFAANGASGLVRKPRHSPLLKMGGAMDNTVRALFAKGDSNRSIAVRLAVSEGTIRTTLKRLGLSRKAMKDEQLMLKCAEAEQQGEALCAAAAAVATAEVTTAEPVLQVDAPAGTSSALSEAPASEPAGNPEACAGGEARVLKEVSEPEPVGARAHDTEPGDRTVDRQLTRLGVLEEAGPLFGNAPAIPGGGVLLAVPLLIGSGLLDVFRTQYQKLTPGFYGLRSVVMTLLFMALLRIKRPENLKEQPPAELGLLLGLDRSPEVKTLRRRMAEMAERNLGMELMRAMAKRRLEEQPERIGFLYLDGHVREYHGKGSLAKGHISRTGRAAKAATDTWANDASGDPLFLVTSELNEGLTQVLEQAAMEVRGLIGPRRRFTMVFDRGGWDREVFARLLAQEVDILTYRKGRCQALPTDSFQTMTEVIDGKKRTFTLHDMSILVGKFKVPTGEDGAESTQPLWLRQVTMLCEDGHQIQVMTSRQDLSAVEVLYRMFNRWRQENFFKYMRQEYAIDALADYRLESVDQARDRPNPERRAIEKEITRARREFDQLSARYGKLLVDNPTNKQPTVADFKLANAELLSAVEDAAARVEALKKKREALPKRVSAGTLERLSPERKLITDTIKMTAYQLETNLVRMVADVYRRTEQDGRKLLVAAFKSQATLEVVGDELRVTLAPQSAAHRDQALAALCQQLNAMNACYPGTALRLRYAVVGVPITLS